MGRTTRREEARLTTAGLPRVAAGHPHEGKAASRIPQLEAIPAATSTRSAAAATVVLPTPSQLGPMNPGARAARVARLPPSAAMARPPAVRKVVPRHTASPARPTVRRIPLDAEGPKVPDAPTADATAAPLPTTAREGVARLTTLQPRSPPTQARVPGVVPARATLQGPCAPTLKASQIPAVLFLAGVRAGTAPARLAASTWRTIGEGQPTPAVIRRPGAKSGQGRAALGLRPAQLRVVRAIPRFRTVGEGPFVGRHVRVDVVRRHEVATLAGTTKGLRSALTSAIGAARPGVRPQRLGAPQGDAVGAPKAPITEITKLELPQPNAEVGAERVTATRRRAEPATLAVPGVLALTAPAVLVHGPRVAVGATTPAGAAVPEIPPAMIAQAVT